MVATDYLVILFYLFGILAAGVFFSTFVKNSKDMFSAGGRSPWWVSGLSGFMTMFSAGTFVVWGGIAYRYGMVAVSISLCYGIAAMMTGYWLAGRWKKLGVSSAAEFLQLRYGKSIVLFYTFIQGLFGLFTYGGSVYALAKITCAVMPLPDGHFLADPATGNLSVLFATLIICALVTIVTLAGGLWAVLMTDVLQFVILTVSVIVVVPLCFMKVGGIGDFIQATPKGFLKPVAVDFTWWFLAGWVMVHFFKIGGEWAFVQRFVCVPTKRDARWSAYIFGVMYLVSPLFWMLPPMIYRTVNPDADHEQAYILACKMVLPPGMVGLMIAAMASATASMVTTQLNVYAGAFTTEFYRRLINKGASEKRLVFVGRFFTLMLGTLILAGAIIIPRYGDYTEYILSVTALLTAPLILPTIWGLFSRKVGLGTAWCATLVGFVVAIPVKFGFCEGGFLLWVEWLEPIAALVQRYSRMTDIVVGTGVPLIILLVMELIARKEHVGWGRVQDFARQQKEDETPAEASPLPAQMVAWCTLLIGGLLCGIGLFQAEGRAILLTAGTMMLLVGIVIKVVAEPLQKKRKKGTIAHG